MAELSVGDALKPFYRGPMMGQERYKMIVKKIKNEEPFKFTKGEIEAVKFADDSYMKIFESENLEKIFNLLRGSSKPFILANVENSKPFGIRRFEKTEEFGGGSSAGKKYDPHELMTAALILKHGGAGKANSTVPPNEYNDLNKAKTAIRNLRSYARSVVYTSGDKTNLITSFEGDYANYGKAISAANGFLASLGNGSRVHRVHATGQQWLQILSKYFAVNNHEYFGKKSYNSSDLIIEVHRRDRLKLFVGISLKKKGIKENEMSPTIINKTVVGEDGLLSFIVGQPTLDSKLKGALGTIYQARSQFFYDVVAAGLDGDDETTQKFSMKKLSIKDGESEVPEVKSTTTMRTGTPMFRKAEEDRAKKVKEKRDANIDEYLADLKKNISTQRQKGQAVLKEAQKLTQEKMTAALQSKWPPKKPVANDYFRELDALIRNKVVMKPLCIGLLNIIFKLDLKKLIADRGKYAEEFAFTLITGAGDLTDAGIQVNAPVVIPEENSTSKLLEMSSSPRAKYLLRKPQGHIQAFERGSKGAKLKYDLLLDNVNIALLEIRYKGSITPEPQFQAYITPSFEKLFKAKDMPKSVY